MIVSLSLVPSATFWPVIRYFKFKLCKNDVIMFQWKVLLHIANEHREKPGENSVVMTPSGTNYLLHVPIYFPEFSERRGYTIEDKILRSDFEGKYTDYFQRDLVALKAVQCEVSILLLTTFRLHFAENLGIGFTCTLKLSLSLFSFASNYLLLIKMYRFYSPMPEITLESDVLLVRNVLLNLLKLESFQATLPENIQNPKTILQIIPSKIIKKLGKNSLVVVFQTSKVLLWKPFLILEKMISKENRRSNQTRIRKSKSVNNSFIINYLSNMIEVFYISRFFVIQSKWDRINQV